MVMPQNAGQGFIKKPMKERLKDTGYLIKNSFKVIGKDKDIIKPTIHIIIFSIITTTFIFLSLLSFFSGKYVGLGILLFVFTIFVLVPIRIFYVVRQKADQSWIVYNTICGGDISYKDAHNHTKEQKSNLRKLAFTELIMRIIKSQKSQKKGIMGMLANLFLAALMEVWDLLSHYMIPAVVIEQKPLKELLVQIKSIRNNVPATLVGVFGIDFVGNVLGSLFKSLYFVLLAISVGIGYLLTSVIPNTVLTIAGFSFSWVPVLIVMYLILLIGTIYKRLVESIKVIYFTIFYTAIMKPNQIAPQMKDELTHYLKMEQQTTLQPQQTAQYQQPPQQ